MERNYTNEELYLLALFDKIYTQWFYNNTIIIADPKMIFNLIPSL